LGVSFFNGGGRAPELINNNLSVTIRWCAFFVFNRIEIGVENMREKYKLDIINFLGTERR
jgi:hypothetical protein